MRELDFDHDRIVITALDEPGVGGASHRYEIALRAPDDAEFYATSGQHKNLATLEINFQNGALSEAGWNGITEEALLAVVLDRFRSFQAGPFTCRENACAITNIEQGVHWLEERKRKRKRRGVEGTHAR